MSDCIVNRVREFRRKREGMTQQVLAQMLGVSRQTVISIEAHRYTASLLLAIKIAHVFETSVEDIFSVSEQDKDSKKKK